MKKLLHLFPMLVLLLAFPCLGDGHESISDGEISPDDQDEPASGDEEAEEEDGSGEEGSFLEPYYESRDSSGCSLSGCCDFGDIFRLITSIDVRYNSDPSEHRRTRVQLGEEGNSAALDVRFGLCGPGDHSGYETRVMFRTSSPLAFDVLHQRIGEDGSGDILITYAGIMSQMVYSSPLQLMAGGQVVFPEEEGRETLTGVGVQIIGEYMIVGEFAVSADCRLSWVRGLPLHRVEMALSWKNAPIELYAGYSILRNSEGRYLGTPCLGTGLFF